MQIKNHIAIFLALLMVTKLFAFDGQLLALAIDHGNLVEIKHSCKIKNFLVAASEAEDVEESPSGLEISYSSFCNSFFNFEVAEPLKVFSFIPFREIISPVLNLHSVERQITSPPPKASV